MDKKMNGFIYTVGMFGTCANPLHQGHVSAIIKAASECKKLFIVLSYSKNRNEPDVSIRHKWIEKTVAHLPNVKIIDLEDNAPTKELYSQQHWEEGAQFVKQTIGQHIDVIYCGSDYKTDCPYKKYYPDSKIVFLERSDIPVSSTKIRNNPLANWEYIAKAARPYFLRKVLIIGHESTGKSVMVQNLALIFNTEYIAEYGREVCERCGGTQNMKKEDFEEIIHYHRKLIQNASYSANRFLFVDTDAITTYWYAKLSNIEIEAPKPDNFDLVIFLEADVPFIQDGFREEENNTDKTRMDTSDKLKEFYKSFGVNFHIVSGETYSERLNKVLEILKKF